MSVGPISLVLTAGAIWLTARGVKLSATAVGAAVLVQVAIMVAVCLLVLVDQRAHLSGIPFSWAHLTGGLAGLSAGIIGVWWVTRLITGDTGSMNPVGLYAECSTLATIVILFVCLLTMLSLPVFMWRRHRDSFSHIRHGVIPALGSITLIVPFVELCQPGQPAPYNAFPFIALALVAAAAVIACLVVHRHPPRRSRRRSGILRNLSESRWAGSLKRGLAPDGGAGPSRGWLGFSDRLRMSLWAILAHRNGG